MGKKKKSIKAEKYAKVGSDDSGKSSSKTLNCKKPRRSKRARYPVKNDDADDFKFRKEVEDGTRKIVDIEADGNCLFGSVSDQLFHDLGNRHGEIRHEICEYLENNKTEFENFLMLQEDDEDVASIEDYVKTLRQDGEWGGNVELVAAARLYRRKIIVFSTEHAFTIEHGQEESGGPDMMLSYHGAEHFNSVRGDTAGLPSPPSKSTDSRSKAVIESEGAEAEAFLEGDKDKMDIDKTAEKKDGPPSKPPPKKNDPCTCGSGLRYKKCCLEADKSKERTRKWKAKHNSDTSDDHSMDGDSNDDNEEKMGGKFRVLKI